LLKKLIAGGNYKVNTKLDRKIIDLFEHIFEVDELQRYDTDQILAHPWLSN